MFVTPERPKTSYLQLHTSNKGRRQIITYSNCRILLGQSSTSRTSSSHQALNVVFYSENMVTHWGKPSQSPLCETNMVIKEKLSITTCYNTTSVQSNGGSLWRTESPFRHLLTVTLNRTRLWTSFLGMREGIEWELIYNSPAEHIYVSRCRLMPEVSHLKKGSPV